jgi:hypothetical protein
MTQPLRVLAATMLVALVASACGGHGTATRNAAHGSEGTSPGTEGGGGNDPPIDASAVPSGSGPTNATNASEANLASDHFSEDDMKTFVYAFDEAATLTAETATLTKTVQSLSASLAARDETSAKSYAEHLLAQAEELEGVATDAGHRLQPLRPSDETLVQARKDGLVTFDLAAQYAATATGVAEAALALDADAAASVARQATSLLDTDGHLTSAYAALTNELEAWASDNPSAAAKAISLYA